MVERIFDGRVRWHIVDVVLDVEPTSVDSMCVLIVIIMHAFR